MRVPLHWSARVSYCYGFSCGIEVKVNVGSIKTFHPSPSELFLPSAWIQIKTRNSRQGDGDGQGGLACFSPWGRKESDTTERLN